ncbi:MAG: hypothetical protein L0387_22185 [Acidobacteria bacterium]|nr:hypothetical protein [Acidobacteriota bacterium]
MTQEYRQLQGKIREVRKRLKWITAAKGLAIALALSLVILAVAVYCADHWNYSDRAVAVARLFSVLAIGGVFGWFLARPLLRRVEDVRVARYIEERHPALQDRLVSAVELGGREVSSAAPNPILPLLLRDALNRSRNIQAKSLFNPREPYLSSSIAFALILFFVMLQVFGPGYFQYATLKLYADWFTPQPVSIYSIEIDPGNVQVRKGSDQLVTARLIGFDSGGVQLYSRRDNSPSWEKNPMDPQKGSNRFGFLFLDINEKVSYYAQSGNVRSAEFSIAVSDTARVEKIDLTYNFPGYTGLPVRKEEDGGEISALKETRVDIQAQTSIDAASARILLQDGTAIPMRKIADKQFAGKVEVKKDSSYKIELTDFAKSSAIGSHEYPITALDDQPPLISFSKPGRDKKVTQLEEVLAEVKANDDFGLNSLKFHYTVNGGKENVVDLFQRNKGEAPKALSGTHTFFLEEFGLEPGDVVSYYARASDARATSTSDIYFLEVRPFGKEFSQAQMAGGMGGGAGEAGSVLSTRQKEILAATWRLIRDQKTFKKGEYSENLKLVASQQQKLQQQTKTLSERIQRRALTTRDPEFQKLSENLEKALEAMTPAQQLLSQEKPNDALTPEQTALNYLMRSEAYFRKIQVAFGNNGGGPGGAATGAQELENLFELELDKLKNQYETQQQRNSMQAGNQVDEALQKLKELAQRQQQLNERRRQQPGSSQGGSQSEQQQIQDEAEKLARQLERLSREAENEEMLNASQRLKQAAQEMRNSGSNAPTGGTQNRGLQALSRLNDARRMMENQRRNSLADDLKQLREDAQQAGHQQEKIREALDKLAQESPANSSSGASQSNAPEQMMKQFQKARQILQEKAGLNKALNSIEQDLFGSARKAASQQKSASQQLQSAGNSMRDQRIQDKISQSGQMIARGLLDIAKERERNIQGLIDDVKQKIDSAEKGLGNSPNDSTTPEERLSRALNQTGDLRENIESLSRRIQEMRRGQERLQAARSGRGKPGKPGEEQGQSSQGKEGEGQQGQASDKPGQQKGENGKDSKEAGQRTNARGQSGQHGEGNSPGQNGNPSSQNAQANANAGGRGANTPRGVNQQNFSHNGERQNYGENYRGEGAINFGDYTLEPPPIHPQQARQFEKEFDLRLKEAQDLSKTLRDRQDLAKQVQDMLERMKQMKSRMLHDAQELERLQGSVIEGFRQLELDLSKNLQQVISRENLHLAKDEDVPEAYRRQVEEYYKALSKRN